MLFVLYKHCALREGPYIIGRFGHSQFPKPNMIDGLSNQVVRPIRMPYRLTKIWLYCIHCIRHTLDMTITIKEMTTPITEMTAGILHCLAYKVPAEMGPTIVEWTQQLWTRPQQCEKCQSVLYKHCAFLNVYIFSCRFSDTYFQNPI